MARILLTASVVAAALSPSLARQFTVKNNCAFAVWPAIFTDLNVAPNTPNHATGWKAAPGSKETFTVPDNWKAGRIWARTDCDFSTNPGPLSCTSGGCNGGLKCDPHSGTGVPPVTLAEFTFQGDGNQDFYDVSVVDGFNLPISVVPSVSACHNAACPKNLNPNCPAALQSKANGKIVGCKSACFANLDGNQANSGNCCSGSHNTPATCPPSGVQFYHYFKDNCPNSYAYAYDESSHTALWTCDSGKKADYTITFCP